MKVNNPFLLKGYVLPIYFCNRAQETETLIQAAINGRDITLYSLRRMGKSGLLHHVGHQLKKNHDYAYVYSDVYNTENVNDLVKSLANNILIQLYPEKNLFQKVGLFFKHISPQISFDQLTGNPKVDFQFVKPNDAFQSLEELFNMVNSFEKKVYWAWDEFQQVNNYDKNILKELRALVQKSNNIRFVFSGSHSNMLISIFNTAKQPFFKSTQLMELNPIDAMDYKTFIAYHFKKAKKTISENAIQQVLAYSLSHTWYTQAICNRLYQKFSIIDINEVKIVLQEILEEQELTFYRFRQLFTAKQWNLVKAFALAERVNMPTAQAFIKQYDLGTSATVLRSLERLKTDEFIVEQYEEGKLYYRLNDVFLIRWIQWKYAN